jgi:phage host-nuclease inhibitor protein Gam
LRDGWSEFYKTLIFPDALNDARIIRSTKRPSDYLTLSGSASAQLGLSSYQAIPNYFVGIGLLFTFIGLVSALYFASGGVTDPDIKKAQEAFKDLLDAATVKFLTSIAGLFSSIFLSMLIKSQTVAIEEKIYIICSELERRVEFITPEQIALGQTRVLEAQREQLERFNTDFAIEIAEAIESRMAASFGAAIGQAVSPMVSSIDKMTETLQRQTQDGVTDLVKQFTNNLRGSAGREMEGIASALSGLQATLESTIGRLNQSGGDFGSKLDGVAERMDALIASATDRMTGSLGNSADRLEKVLSDMAGELRSQMQGIGAALKTMTQDSANALGSGAQNAADSLTNAANTAGANITNSFAAISESMEEKLGPLAAALSSVEGSLRTLDARLTTQFTDLERTLARTRELILSFDGAADRLRDAGTPIALTADKFTLVAGRIHDTAQTMGEAHTAVRELTTSLTLTARALHDSSKLYQQGTTEIDEKLGRIFDGMREATTQYHRAISEFVAKVDEQFASSIRLLGGGIEDLRPVVEDLRDAAELMKLNGRS